jgi:hypothetical protein
MHFKHFKVSSTLQALHNSCIIACLLNTSRHGTEISIKKILVLSQIKNLGYVHMVYKASRHVELWEGRGGWRTIPTHSVFRYKVVVCGILHKRTVWTTGHTAYVDPLYSRLAWIMQRNPRSSRAVISKLGYAYIQGYEPRHLGVRKKKLIM